MIRLFNRYLLRQALTRALFDVGLILLLMAGVFFALVGSIDALLPVASSHMLSLAAGVMMINSASGLYKKQADASPAESFARASMALLIALPFTYLVFSFLPAGFEHRDAIRSAAMAGVSALVLRRVYITRWPRGMARAGSRVLVYGTGDAAQMVGRTLAESAPHCEIVGFVSGPNEREPMVVDAKVLRPTKPLPEFARELGVGEIVVALAERRAGSMPLRQLLDCKLHGIKVYDVATHFEKTLGQIRVDFTSAGWLIFGDGFNQGTLRTAVKRVFDLASAASLIVLTAPVMLVTAALVKLESRGPVLYRQERVGLNGRAFSVVKFRSMRADAEKDGQPRWAAAIDDRVTRVGRMIRRLRIDELPQLFNVLRGEMSLVGPRPERAYFVDQLMQQIPYYAVRHSVKPGLTGWAQVRYQYGATVEDSQQKLQYDLYYVKNHTLFLDLMIMLETVGVVLTGKGAR